ncbi:MAG: SIR2 family protein [Peptococcaceae bacterium]|nr:SIR2 family protein [Peptococcaceae bacterium]
MEQVKEKIERLIKRLLQQKVVPFLESSSPAFVGGVPRKRRNSLCGEYGQRLRCLKIYKISERSWARDLFRDRLRSRTFLFSGFGSDEPQVRHTALQVVEEFQKPLAETINDWWTLPNAPFIASYGSSISSTSFQGLSHGDFIMLGFFTR